MIAARTRSPPLQDSHIMSNRSIGLDDRLNDYLMRTSVREPEILARLRAETARLGGSARMQISPDQGQFMALLVRLTGARRLLEVGTFTGYSALACALALPPDGRILCCDIDDDWTSIARRYWMEAGVADRMDLRLAPALETLDGLIEDGQADGFDMAFIDADKVNYDGYYERALKLVRRGGLILVDNTLWGGTVADPLDQRPDTIAIRRLNEKIGRDDRVAICQIPIADGLTIALRQV